MFKDVHISIVSHSPYPSAFISTATRLLVNELFDFNTEEENTLTIVFPNTQRLFIGAINYLKFTGLETYRKNLPPGASLYSCGFEGVSRVSTSRQRRQHRRLV